MKKEVSCGSVSVLLRMTKEFNAAEEEEEAIGVARVVAFNSQWTSGVWRWPYMYGKCVTLHTWKR